MDTLRIAVFLSSLLYPPPSTHTQKEIVFFSLIVDIHLFWEGETT